MKASREERKCKEVQCVKKEIPRKPGSPIPTVPLLPEAVDVLKKIARTYDSYPFAWGDFLVMRVQQKW